MSGIGSIIDKFKKGATSGAAQGIAEKEEFEIGSATIMLRIIGRLEFGGAGSKSDIESDVAPLEDVSTGVASTTQPGAIQNAMEKKKDSKVTSGKVTDVENDPKNLIFPINPEEITIEQSVDVNSHSTNFYGEICTFGSSKLRTLSIESFFPFDTEYSYGIQRKIWPQKRYIDYLNKAMERKYILIFSISGDINYLQPFTVIVESFAYTISGDRDIKFSLSLREYIDYRTLERISYFTVTDSKTIVDTTPKQRVNLSDKINILSVVKVVDGLVFSSSLGEGTVSISTVTKLYNKSPESFISLDTFFKASELAESIKRSRGLEWTVIGSVPLHSFNTGSMKALYESIKSNEIQIDKVHNIMIKCNTTDDVGWVNIHQLELVR